MKHVPPIIILFRWPRMDVFVLFSILRLGILSIPRKRILKDVRSGLLGYGGFRAYPESGY